MFHVRSFIRLTIVVCLVLMHLGSQRTATVAIQYDGPPTNFSQNLWLKTLSQDQSQSTQVEPECPADRLEAAEIGRQCSRKCKRETGCENVRKQCICDGLCGLSCLKPDLVCPDLPKIENGRFSPSSTLFTTEVTYQCDTGYFLYGSKQRVCQGDEEWSGIPVECTRERKYYQLVIFRSDPHLFLIFIKYYNANDLSD